jgi:hypothetical protein
MNILNQKFRILSLTFLLASLASSNCSNITDERSACEYRVSQLLQTCTVASLLWPNYYFGQESTEDTVSRSERLSSNKKRFR